MICTGTILAAFEIPIILIGLFLGQYLARQYGVWIGVLSSLFFTTGGLTIFHRWYWNEWPFIRKVKPKEDEP